MRNFYLTLLLRKILQETLNPVYVISGNRYIWFAVNPIWLTSLYPVYVISGIRYIRFALNRVCATKFKGEQTPHIIQKSRFLNSLIVLQNVKGGTFSAMKKFPTKLFPKKVERGTLCFGMVLYFMSEALDVYEVLMVKVHRVQKVDHSE